jgi:hypothetical protein
MVGGWQVSVAQAFLPVLVLRQLETSRKYENPHRQECPCYGFNARTASRRAPVRRPSTSPNPALRRRWV